MKTPDSDKYHVFSDMRDLDLKMNKQTKRDQQKGGGGQEKVTGVNTI
jgi:hypothetical protein